MCFSATASFTTSAVLGVMGFAAVSRVNKSRELPFAMIPLFFALQQAMEGGLWLSLDGGDGSAILAYSFLFFAFLFWPVYFPWCALLLEDDPYRKRWIRTLFGLGALLAMVLFLNLLSEPLQVGIVGHSIQYSVGDSFDGFGLFVYASALCGSGFLSSNKTAQIFATAALLSLFVSLLFYFEAFTSVWCFFAAVLSAIIVLHFFPTRRSKRTN